MINIIDRGFNFLGQIDSYESFIFTKSYSGIGSFELHLNDDLVNTDKLIKENIIFTSPKKAYVILHREINSKDGKLVIKGKELKSYLARSPIFPPTGQAYYRVNSNVETIMKTYVQSTLTRKGITNIVVAANQNRGDTLVYQTRYKNLADELEKLSLASNLGWDIALDLVNKKFVLDVVEGQDRTASQTILPPAIFSVDYDNIAEQTFVDSKLNYANVAIVAGQGEGADRAISIVGDATGLDSYEIFVDARDIENNVDLPARGNAKLSEHQEVATFDSQVLTDKNLVYEEDFNLGDTVTVQNKKWNVTLDTKINAVTEIYESSGFRLDITFGSNIPEITDIIKQATDTPIVEGGSVPDANIIPIESTNFIANNVEGALDELFINVSDGKGLIATAITDKGITADGSETFQSLANKIMQISSIINLINPANTLFRFNDGHVIVNGYGTKVTAGSTELGGYLVQVKPNAQYKITYDFTGSSATTRILTYTALPSLITNYTADTVSSFGSSYIWTCPSNINYVVVGHYSTANGNFSNWKMIEI